MCLKNKIIAVALGVLVGGVGIFGIQGTVVHAQNAGASGGAALSIDQLQQVVNNLLKQIQQLIQSIAQLKPLETCGNGICRFGETAANCVADCGIAAICAKEGETFYDGENKKCCAGLATNTIKPAGVSSVWLYSCVNPGLVCAKEGETFTDGAKQCCSGLVKNIAPTATSSVLIYTCRGAGVCNPGMVDGCRVCGSDGWYKDTDSKCPIGQKCWQGACYACAKENIAFYEEGRACCAGLVKKTIPYAAGTDGVDSYKCVTGTAALDSKTVCATNADCVSDGGTCHRCYNAAWFKTQIAATGASQYACKGIGNSICQCKSGNCASVAICGDGACNPAYENSVNCVADCAAAAACVKEYGIIDPSSANKCCAGLEMQKQALQCAGSTTGAGCGGTAVYLCMKPVIAVQCYSQGQGMTGYGTSNANCCSGLVAAPRISQGSNGLLSSTEGFVCIKVGDGVCGLGETTFNSSDCKPTVTVMACTLKNNGCSYTGGFMTFDCSGHGGGNFIAAGCNSICEPYGKCYRSDGTAVAVP